MKPFREIQNIWTITPPHARKVWLVLLILAALLAFGIGSASAATPAEMARQVLGDGTVQRAHLYLGASVIGMVAHALKQWAVDNTPCITTYFLRQSPGLSFAALIGNLTAGAAMIGTGALDGVSLAAALGLGLTQGYSADSLINRGTRVIYTDEERALMRGERA